MAIPKKIDDRIKVGLKKYQPVLANAKLRDVGEADTVTIIKDMLSDVFGYDKYSEITSEYAIRGTYCDLAIKLDGKLSTLIEVKAVGIELKDQHVKQAIDYGANQGVDWIMLTNGITWQVYKLTFSKPIEKELVLNFDVTSINPRLDKDVESLYLLCKEGWQRSALGEYHTQKQALSRFFMGAMLQAAPVLDVIRKELRKVSPDVKITNEEIKDVLINEVIKREVLEGDKASDASKKVGRVASKARAASKSVKLLKPD
ncbi:MAG: type I restriction enzyme HsdR N-terminal domain-containing protein [Betaproteobacteria bacterium]|nr:type I restriction enzyme HsdR N-terminal domain-containing protein [Betaproteobacteria bacterium]